MEGHKGSGETGSWMFLASLVPAVGVLAWGSWLMSTHQGGQSLIAAGICGIIGIMAVWALAISIRQMRQSDTAQRQQQLGLLHDRLADISTLINQVSKQQLISERAKAIAFRFNERDALRQAIREEIARKDYDAALILANDIESSFGYRMEADSFREEISLLRESEVRRNVGDAIAVVDRACRIEDWSAAMREADRIARIYSTDLQASKLPSDVERRRLTHKKQLVDGFHDAVGRNDVDGSIEILKKLDAYLTPAEAEPMRETVQQVFKDKLHLLGQQFTFAVRDHKWPEAIRVGEILMRDFPNSRMAQEVREKMDLMKQRATEPEPARV